MFQVKQINETIVLGILNLKAFSILNPNYTKRELEKKGSLSLIQGILMDESIQIQYTAEGKPMLSERTEHISISHSHDLLVIIVNRSQNTGCDVELIRDKVLSIQHKFLSESEKKACNSEIEKLIIYWAAKETLYKLYGLKGLDFIENLAIINFDKHKIIAKITNGQYQKTYLLCWEKLDNYILVYCIDEV